MIGFLWGLVGAVVGFALALTVIWAICGIVQWVMTRDENR